jgi:hypothetical protein
MKGGGSEWERDMRGQRHSREGTFENLGEGSIFLEIRDYIFWFVFFWLEVWVEFYRGASVAGSFGLGGQESSQNLRARESDKLCS